MQTIIVERADGVVTVTLNRPDRKNAMTLEMVAELTTTLDEIATRRDDRVVVVTGAGDAFCSGADLGDLAWARNGAGDALAGLRAAQRVILRLHELPQPTVASVRGVAVGWGLNLALSCDLVVAAEDARFSEIFAQRGLSLDGGGSWLLPRLIGLHKAKEIAFLADLLSAEEALWYGLVNRVVAVEDLTPTTAALAAKLASRAPIPLSLMKRQLNQAFSTSMSEALEGEAVAQALSFGSADVDEALAAFAEKREPRFTGS